MGLQQSFNKYSLNIIGVGDKSTKKDKPSQLSLMEQLLCALDYATEDDVISLIVQMRKHITERFCNLCTVTP
jgi:hypothetical protein